MNSPSLRHVLLKFYFPAAFLVAIFLAILDATMQPALGQVRTATVTVYVTVVHTVPVYVPITAYVTVASVATSFMTLTNTVVSLGTVTLWNTVSLWNTVTTAATGILGPMLANIFGQYSDVALTGIGVLGGVAVGLVSSSLIGAKLRHARLNESLLQFDRISEAILQAEDSWEELTAAHCITNNGYATSSQGLQVFSVRAKQIEEKWQKMPEELARYRRKIARDLL